MTQLNDEQKSLLLDYCMGLTSPQESAQVLSLLAYNKDAEEIYAQFKAAMSPLESVEPKTCPDELVERTIVYLNNTVSTGQQDLERLLASEQAKAAVGSRRLWLSFGQIAAVAATIVIVTGAMFAPLNFMRQKSWQQQCQFQLGNVFRGLSNYISENNNQMPAVARSSNDPWWKVGYQGNENHSNTRPIWLLVKNGYVKQNNFICPSSRGPRPTQIKQVNIKRYYDFPSRRFVTYSFAIVPKKCATTGQVSQKILCSDLNPLFDKLPNDYSKPFTLKLSKKLLKMNSPNHKHRGQNLLFCDGSVKFVKKRSIGISKDDVFTLNNTSQNKGTETPTTVSDAFLAP